MKKLTALMVALALAACGENKPEKVGDNSVDVGFGGYSAYVRMVTTTDGTRCAVMVGLERGGITCDWEASRKENKQ